MPVNHGAESGKGRVSTTSSSPFEVVDCCSLVFISYCISGCTFSKDLPHPLPNILLPISRIENNPLDFPLDEVVVGPENTEKFLDLKEEEFKRTYYDFDKSSKIENQILKAGTFNNGLNFINLYKMITKSANKNEEIDKKFSNVNYKPSDLIREVYDDAFFVKSLGLKKQNISEFLLYCDDKFPSKFLIKKSNEFQLLDFLIKQSDKFKKILERS